MLLSVAELAAAGDECLFSDHNIIPPIMGGDLPGLGVGILISDEPGKAASRSRTGDDPKPPKRYIFRG